MQSCRCTVSHLLAAVPAMVAALAAIVVEPGLARAEPFTLTSSAFADGAVIPKKYAGFHPARKPPCGGENVSPPLSWTNAPAATKSFAIVMFDADGGRGTGSVHWVAYGMPAARTGLKEGEGSKPPTEWTGDRNTVSWNYYFGPCGPAGDSPHHYIITLIATSLTPGELKPGLTRDEFLGTLRKQRGRALAPASIVGKYVRGM
jgi:Raf kinase inhibitor-like YbhB/YbcL family protein